MVTDLQVAPGRKLMDAPGRKSLVDTAVILGVRSGELDQAIWSRIGQPIETLLGHRDFPPPMF